MRALPATLTVAGTVLLSTAVAAGQVAPTTVPSGDPGQAFFRTALVKDARTTGAVRRALTSGAAIVDPATQYADLTGDGRDDAVVRVHSTGAAGVVAVYVFSTDGAARAGDLRAIFRSQSVYRAVTQLDDRRTLQIDQPRYAPGDDLCCPARLTRRRYRFSAGRRLFVRTSLETVTLR